MTRILPGTRRNERWLGSFQCPASHPFHESLPLRARRERFSFCSGGRGGRQACFRILRSFARRTTHCRSRCTLGSQRVERTPSTLTVSQTLQPYAFHRETS